MNKIFYLAKKLDSRTKGDVHNNVIQFALSGSCLQVQWPPRAIITLTY